MSSFVRDTLTITRKEMLLFVKQPVFGIMRSVLFPIIWIVFFAYGFGGTLRAIPVAVVNEAGGAFSQQLVDAISIGGTFDIHFLPYYKALEEFQSSKVSAVINIPADFDSGVKSGSAKAYLIMDSTNPTLSAAVLSKVQTSVQGVSTAISIVHPASLDTEVFYGREIRYLDFLAPGIIMQTIVFSAMFSGGISLLMDREFGTLKLLMLAPISRSSIILGKTLGGVIEALVSGFMTLLIIIVLGVKIKYNLLFFFVLPLIMTLLAFAFIGLSTLLATKLRRLEQFVLVMQITILPLWFVSGAIYPIYSMPDWMKAIATVNPLTYAVDGIRSVMIKGNLLAPIIPDIVALTVFSAIVLLIGIMSFKRTIE